MAAKIPEQVFPCLREDVKSEIPETYQEFKLLMEILDSVKSHLSVGLTSKETLELMGKALNDQFARYRVSWIDLMRGVKDDAIFLEIDATFWALVEVVESAEEAVDRALATINAVPPEHNAKMERDVTPEAMSVVPKSLPPDVSSTFKTSEVRKIHDVDIPSTCKTPAGITPAGKTPAGKAP